MNNKLISEGEDFDKIQEIIDKIKKAIKVFYKKNNRPDPTSNFKWEVILVDNKSKKCMVYARRKNGRLFWNTRYS